MNTITFTKYPEVFVLVADDDTYPAWTPGTIPLWSTERAAAEFVAANQIDGVDVASVECPAGLLELLDDLRGVGCERVNLDGAALSISQAIESLRRENDLILSIPSLAAANVSAHMETAS